MKKYRRIEITAFRRRITLISGESEIINKEIRINDGDSSEMIDTESVEGQRILNEAVSWLNENLAEQKQKDL